jgi:hypothetical protein
LLVGTAEKNRRRGSLDVARQHQPIEQTHRRRIELLVFVIENAGFSAVHRRAEEEIALFADAFGTDIADPFLPLFVERNRQLPRRPQPLLERHFLLQRINDVGGKRHKRKLLSGLDRCRMAQRIPPSRCIVRCRNHREKAGRLAGGAQWNSNPQWRFSESTQLDCGMRLI